MTKATFHFTNKSGSRPDHNDDRHIHDKCILAPAKTKKQDRRPDHDDDEWHPVRRIDGIKGDYVQVVTLHGNIDYDSYFDKNKKVPDWETSNNDLGWRSSTYIFVVDNDVSLTFYLDSLIK